MSVKHEFLVTNIHNLPLPEDTTVLHACACGFRNKYSSITDTPHRIYYYPPTETFTVQCPSCKRNRPSKIMSGGFDEGQFIFISAGEFKNSPGVTETGTKIYKDL